MFCRKHFYCSLLVLSLGCGLSLSKTLEHTFNVKYSSGAPDGVEKSKILTINGLFPGPQIVATVGDTILITLINKIQDGQNTSIHWHGVHQRGTPFQDGTNMIAQCPLKNGEKQLYNFSVPVAGSYWYHAHTKSQYVEGLWGTLIVKNTEEIYDYDEEITVTIGDWYHRTVEELEYWHLSKLSRGAPPFPDSALMNGRGRTNCTIAIANKFKCEPNHQKRPIFKVKPGKTYRIRVINVSGYSAFRFSIDGHKLRAIEVDTVDVRKTPGVDVAVIASAQRYSFLVTMNGTEDRYLIRADLMSEILFRDGQNINEHPDALMANATGVLKYVRRKDRADDWGMEQFDFNQKLLPSTFSKLKDPVYLNDDLLQDHSGTKAPGWYDEEFVLNVTFIEDEHGIRRGSLNNISFKLPSDKPLLLKMIDNDSISELHNPLFLRWGDVIQVVINNPFDGRHPFHFHGHSFWVLGTGVEDDGPYDQLKHNLKFDGVRRDTTMVYQNSWVVIRFLADNPGLWALHCHIDWHNLSGMAAVFVEAKERAHNLTIPMESLRVCSKHGISLNSHPYPPEQ